mmetsp:Transcript_23790/g.64798  ORF Transcript_23790/g.64798 Transcript_23790/m.64798 type:complete len:256 (+) Transcript_23790:315-1082(+)
MRRWRRRRRASSTRPRPRGPPGWPRWGRARRTASPGSVRGSWSRTLPPRATFSGALPPSRPSKAPSSRSSCRACWARTCSSVPFTGSWWSRGRGCRPCTRTAARSRCPTPPTRSTRTSSTCTRTSRWRTAAPTCCRVPMPTPPVPTSSHRRPTPTSSSAGARTALSPSPRPRAHASSVTAGSSMRAPPGRRQGFGWATTSTSAAPRSASRRTPTSPSARWTRQAPSSGDSWGSRAWASACATYGTAPACPLASSP